jgi:hypothetical protein
VAKISTQMAVMPMAHFASELDLGRKRPSIIPAMKSLEQLCRQLAAGEFEFSRHAFKRAVERNISEREIREAGGTAELIEDYPEDKYSPSCLILGWTKENRPLHIQISYIDTALVRIVTIYEPDPVEWTEFRKRR